ncbi:GcvH: glycine cleavage system, H protein [Desulfosarcina variabilis str. Montpellier]|uniref:glycine cleavage system protein GcvH n=1 Tax=Desulfosarcina variabilis TaxID=2300 RepID=UPI003AFA2644
MSKAISDLVFPDDVRYTDDHEWARQEGETVKVGITDYAQDQLGDIVFVELPEVGSTFEHGEEFGTLESVKAVSELYMPIGGEIVAINEALADTPEQVNGDPYGDGWMIVIKPADIGEFEALKDKDAYLAMLKGSEG